jgi:carboxyl-terminal processing protease
MRAINYRRTFALPLLALALVVVLASCQTMGLGSGTVTPTPPSDIAAVVQVWSQLSQTTTTPEDNPIVEVWNTLAQESVTKDEIDIAALSQAAIAAMQQAVEGGGDTVDAATLTEAAVDGMLKALGDPYAAYMSPHEYEMTLSEIQGQFEGIGAMVGFEDDRITVTAPLPDTPAEKAGILPGDVILEVDGASTEGWTITEAVFKIRGLKGTSVRLLVQHQDGPEPVYIDIVRGVIKQESVIWEMLPGDIAHVSINGFMENTDEDLADALKEIGDQDAQGIVLDLRDNLGGLLSTTVNVASQFIDDGLVLYSVDGGGERIDYPVKEGYTVTDIPMVILVNWLSASGSEVLSAAIRDHGRAILIGTTTFGKGSVNVPKRLNNGSGLYFTIARWYSPNGHLIEGDGLEPDIRVEEEHGSTGNLALEKALEYLRS